jgi:hypothetical protein
MLAAVLPDARLQVQPGVGHLAMLESPEATARAVLGLAEGATGGAAGSAAEARGAGVRVAATPGVPASV